MIAQSEPTLNESVPKDPGSAPWWQDLLTRVTGPSDEGKVDRWMLAIVLFLVAFGIVMVYSASAAVAEEEMKDALYFVKHQLMGVGVGIVGMAILARIPPRYFARYGLAFYVSTVVGLCMVWLPGLGYRANGSTRWLGFGSIHLQPSEFAKLALVLVLGDYISRHAGRMDDWRKGYGMVGLIALPAVVLVFAEPDFGTTAILLGLVGLALILGGLSYRYMGMVGLIGVTAVIPALAFSPYRMERVKSWLDPWKVADGDGYQVIQSWIALYTGGWTGQGLGNSLSKLHFLPEPWTDFVAAVVGEELGLIGFLVLMSAYVIFMWRGVVITRNSATYFGMLVAGCLTALIGTQAFLNMAVVLGLVPPKGLVLPFVSYGPSALIAHFWCIGLLLAISAERRRPEGRPVHGLGTASWRDTGPEQTELGNPTSA